MLALIWKSGKFFSGDRLYAHGLTQSYIESKITPDVSVEDLQPWINRVWRDAGSHSAFADVALRVGLYHYDLTGDDNVFISSVSRRLLLCLMWNLLAICADCYTHMK